MSLTNKVIALYCTLCSCIQAMRIAEQLRWLPIALPAVEESGHSAMYGPQAFVEFEVSWLAFFSKTMTGGGWEPNIACLFNLGK